MGKTCLKTLKNLNCFLKNAVFKILLAAFNQYLSCIGLKGIDFEDFVFLKN